MPCPPPGNLSDPGIKPVSHTAPALQVDSLQAPGKPECIPISVQRLDLINSCPELGVKGRPNFKRSQRRFWRRLSGSVPLLPCCWCCFFCDPMDCSLPGFSDHGIFPARILEMIAISDCRESSGPRDRNFVS